MERVVYTMMSGCPGGSIRENLNSCDFLIFWLDKHDAISYNTTQLAK